MPEHRPSSGHRAGGQHRKSARPAPRQSASPLQAWRIRHPAAGAGHRIPETTEAPHRQQHAVSETAHHAPETATAGQNDRRYCQHRIPALTPPAYQPQTAPSQPQATARYPEDLTRGHGPVSAIAGSHRECPATEDRRSAARKQQPEHHPSEEDQTNRNTQGKAGCPSL